MTILKCGQLTILNLGLHMLVLFELVSSSLLFCKEVECPQSLVQPRKIQSEVAVRALG